LLIKAGHEHDQISTCPAYPARVSLNYYFDSPN